MRAVVGVLLLVTAVHAAMWGAFQEKQQAPDFAGVLPSVSYAPFEPGHTVDTAADTEKVRADLSKLASLSRSVRLYSSTEGNELVPAVAAETVAQEQELISLCRSPDFSLEKLRAAVSQTHD